MQANCMRLFSLCKSKGHKSAYHFIPAQWLSACGKFKFSKILKYLLHFCSSEAYHPYANPASKTHHSCMRA